MSARRIVIEVLGDDKSLSKTLGHIDSQTGTLGGKLKKFGKVAAVGFGIAAAAGIVVGKKLVDAGERAGTANARIEQIAGSMGLFGNQAGKVSERLVDLANKTALQTGMDQNAIKETQAKLLTFKDLAASADEVGGSFDRATQAAVDLEAAGFGTASTNAVQLGKALNDPIKGLTALARSGVTFTETEKERIATLVESGKQGKAQELILAAIEKQVGGTAVATANGTDRMKVGFSQLSEAIGLKLVPIVDTLSTWLVDKAIPALSATADWVAAKLSPALHEISDFITGQVVPAVEKFAGEMQSGQGAGGVFVDVLDKLKDALGKVWNILVPVFTFMGKNKTVVATFAGVILTVVAALKVWTAVQLVLNAVLAANPLGLVVIALAAVAAGLVYAYKHSETFRTVVQTAFSVVKAAIGPLVASFENLWAGMKAVFTWAKNNWPLLLGILTGPIGLAVVEIIKHWDKIKSTAQAIPGAITAAFSGAKDLLVNIGKDIIGGLISGITSKIGELTSKLQGITKLIPKVKGPESKDKILLKPAGAALIDGLIAGIEKGKVKLTRVLDKLTEFIKKHQDKLATLLDKRQSIIDSFTGTAASIFSTDLKVEEGQAPKGVQDLLAFGAAQRARAERLRGDVGTLAAKGLSKDLLNQLVNAGEAGTEQIHLLASATEDQIAQANADNLATQRALQDAGLEASKALGIEQAIRQEERDIRLAQGIKQSLKELLDQENKNTVVELHLDGHRILWSLKKIKRQNGGHLGLGDNDK